MGKIIFASLVAFFSMLYFVYIAGDEQSDECNALYEIANNAEKLDYLNTWISINLKNEKDIEMFGPAGIIRSPSSLDAVNFNWKLIGLDSSKLSIMLDAKSLKEGLHIHNIKSVSFIYGRYAVLSIAQDSDKKFSNLTDNQKKYGKLISNGVYISCQRDKLNPLNVSSDN